MGSFSPYSINEADPPKWRPGEDLAASAFIGMSLLLFVEVNVLIFRAFKKRQGLYFWSMQMGSLGVLINTVGIILKFFPLPSTQGIWPLYTLLITAGWTVYVTAQSLVLYSRLHLVLRSQRIQRYVLFMILSTILTFIVPTWVVLWPAYNSLDHEMSSTWSPRFAIVVRYTQIGYTITESIISGLYIWSLVWLSRLKSNVRQRRVMTDLIYVNVVVIAFDVFLVTLIYTNQGGFSYPVQTFSYILKLRLEFIVLNQLMDVAARGMRRGTFGENRYYHTANRANMPSNESAPSQQAKNSPLTIKNDIPKDPAQTTFPLSMPLSDSIALPQSTYQFRSTNRLGSDAQISGPESEPESSSFDHIGIAEGGDFSSDGKPLTQPTKLGAGFLDKLGQPSKGFKTRSSGRSKDSTLLAFRKGDRSHCGNPGDNVEDEMEGIELHQWERRGAILFEVPWFRSKVEA